LAIGSTLKAEYDAAATPLPSSLAVLVKQLEMQIIQRRHWLDYDPVALAVLVIGIGIIELLALII
jgi:hypothetical protein